MRRILSFIKPEKNKFIFACLFLIIGISLFIIVCSYGESGFRRHPYLFNFITKITAWPLIPIFALKISQNIFDKFLNIIGIPVFFIYYYCVGCLSSKFFKFILKKCSKDLSQK